MNSICTNYIDDEGCWKQENKICPYHHKPLFNFDKLIPVFQCSKRDLRIPNYYPTYRITIYTKNGIDFYCFDSYADGWILLDNQYQINKLDDIFRVGDIFKGSPDNFDSMNDKLHISLIDVYNLSNQSKIIATTLGDEQNDFDYKFYGKDSNKIMKYLRFIMDTIEKLMLLEYLCQSKDVKNIIKLNLMKEHPKYLLEIGI